MNRLIALLFGLLSYACALAALLYAIGFVSGMVVPKTIDDGAVVPMEEALLVNVALIALFGMQHSVMARQGFKAWWTRVVPKAVERSTYVLFSSIALVLLCWQWRPMPAVIWQIDDRALAATASGLSFVGWFVVLTSTFLINHFELFGLQQVVSNLRDRPLPAARFRTPLFYRFVRHPIYFGFMIAFWVTPTMTAGHLLFASVITAYVIVGVLLEERDLLALFGDDYRRYRERVSMLVPWRKSTVAAGRAGSARPAHRS